jgi:hypothetical protein
MMISRLIGGTAAALVATSAFAQVPSKQFPAAVAPAPTIQSSAPVALAKSWPAAQAPVAPSKMYPAAQAPAAPAKTYPAAQAGAPAVPAKTYPMGQTQSAPAKVMSATPAAPATSAPARAEAARTEKEVVMIPGDGLRHRWYRQAATQLAWTSGALPEIRGQPTTRLA